MLLKSLRPNGHLKRHLNQVNPAFVAKNFSYDDLRFFSILLNLLSYDVASGSEIMPCNKIDKPLVVYRFSGNFMTSITALRT